MWHVTWDTEELWTLSQNVSSYCLGVRVFCCFFSQRMTELHIHWINYSVTKVFVEHLRLHRVCIFKQPLNCAWKCKLTKHWKIYKSISQAASGCRAGQGCLDQCSAGQLQTMHLIEQPVGDPSVSCTICCCAAPCAAPSEPSVSCTICCCAAPYAAPSQPSVLLCCTTCSTTQETLTNSPPDKGRMQHTFVSTTLKKLLYQDIFLDDVPT